MQRFHCQLNPLFLTNLGLRPSDKRKYMEKIQDKALTASAWIWQSSRLTTVWQNLVVSWDTAGAYWASGYDALAPKPCLNPESSSDESFVGRMLLYNHKLLHDSYTRKFFSRNLVINVILYVYVIGLYIYIYIYIYVCVCVCVKNMSETGTIHKNRYNYFTNFTKIDMYL